MDRAAREIDEAAAFGDRDDGVTDIQLLRAVEEAEVAIQAQAAQDEEDREVIRPAGLASNRMGDDGRVMSQRGRSFLVRLLRCRYKRKAFPKRRADGDPNKSFLEREIDELKMKIAVHQWFVRGGLRIALNERHVRRRERYRRRYRRYMRWVAQSMVEDEEEMEEVEYTPRWEMKRVWQRIRKGP